MERAFEVITDDEPDEDLAVLAARSLEATGSAATSTGAAERAELASTSPRPSVYPDALALALRAKAAVVFSRGHIEESARCSGARSRSRSSTTSWRTRAPVTSCSPTAASGATATPALGYHDEALALARKLGTGRTSGRRSPR